MAGCGNVAAAAAAAAALSAEESGHGSPPSVTHDSLGGIVSGTRLVHTDYLGVGSCPKRSALIPQEQGIQNNKSDNRQARPPPTHGGPPHSHPPREHRFLINLIGQVRAVRAAHRGSRCSPQIGPGSRKRRKNPTLTRLFFFRWYLSSGSRGYGQGDGGGGGAAVTETSLQR